jgi:hypothetical protein
MRKRGVNGFAYFLLPVLITDWIVHCYSAYAAVEDEHLLLNPIDGKIIQKIGPPKPSRHFLEGQGKGSSDCVIEKCHFEIEAGINWLSEDQAQIIKDQPCRQW